MSKNYILVINGNIEKYPYSVEQLFADNSNTSFPQTLNEEALAAWGVYPVETVIAPTVDYTKNVTEDTPVNDSGWKQVWLVSDASSEQIAKRTQQKEEEIRNQRNKLLTASDWTQLSDAPVDKAAWAVYRQALRDIPSQAGFPWEVVWPTTP